VAVNRLVHSQSQIVVYRGDFLENEIKRYNQVLINRLFQKCLFAYSMQQKQWKKQIELLTSQKSFPFKAFCVIFPKLVEIAKPKDKLYLMFKLFGQFAKNPSEEICGRFFGLIIMVFILIVIKVKSVFLMIPYVWLHAMRW